MGKIFEKNRSMGAFFSFWPFFPNSAFFSRKWPFFYLQTTTRLKIIFCHFSNETIKKKVPKKAPIEQFFVEKFFRFRDLDILKLSIFDF
jgi:hypothetical protein